MRGRPAGPLPSAKLPRRGHSPWRSCRQSGPATHCLSSCFRSPGTSESHDLEPMRGRPAGPLPSGKLPRLLLGSALRFLLGPVAFFFALPLLGRAALLGRGGLASGAFCLCGRCGGGRRGPSAGLFLFLAPPPPGLGSPPHPPPPRRPPG